MPDALQPPVAPRRPFTRTVHGDAVEDPYAWMADKSDPELLAHLEAENSWTERHTGHLAALTDTFYADIRARTQQTDMSVPLHVSHSDGSAYWYYGRTTEGDDYGRSCRLPATSREEIPDVTEPSPDEEVILDVQALAQDHAYFALGLAQVSPDGRRLAYSVDTTGDERYDLYVRDLATGEVIDGPVPGVAAGGAWAGPDWLFYLRVDAAWRPHQVWRHEIRSDTPDALVLDEPDDRFWVSVDSSRDDQWILVELASKTTTETHLLRADDPTGELRVVQPRRPGLEYAVELAPDALWILNNDEAPQFKLSRAPLDAPGIEHWETIVEERPETRLLGASVYASAIVIDHRTNGLSGIAILPRDDDGTLGVLTDLTFDEALYDVGSEDAPDFDTEHIRFGYESLTTPVGVWEYTLRTGARRLLKQVPVRDHPDAGPYDPTDYISERLWAESADGTRVPISLVRHRDTPVDGTAPGLMYGYGAYEVPTMPYFAMSRISLLDRGFVFAIAHVRGGGELGRPWYDGGKLLDKPNTFADFVACGRVLVDEGYVAPDRLVAEGGSAGGLLIGAAVNLAPDLFRAVHAAVPFVDPLTTILNPDLPLTVMEWEEWGNPVEDAAVYACMKGYSPYENVAAVQYPAILATTSLNDTRVEVTEPAKWVARLRERATNGPDRPILLKTEMVAGHGGVSGRYQAWRQRAFELAWMVDQVGG
ncbi:MAG: S9 family peptidase [Propionibacteriaceae bacterium]|nr:S9 family peptidase [Propionibacteriaceae bacterium]